MKNSNTSETERVRRYLLQKIVHSGAEPERLPTEMFLAETIGVSRVTVRRAISDLLEGRYIQKISGRQGIYTNPAMVDVTMHSIAILQTNNYTDSRLLSIMGAMGDELMRNNCFCSYNFFCTGNDSQEMVVHELRNFGFDCIIAGAVHPLANRLLEEGLPVLILEIPGYASCGQGNYISFDNQDFGRKVAEAVIRKELKKILFFGNLSEIRDGFEAAGEDEFEVTVFEEHLNRDGLKEVLENGDFSGVVAMTREVGLRALYDVLRELKNKSRPQLFLYPWKEAEVFKRDNPEYITEVFDPDFFTGQFRELGKAAARGVMNIINDLPVDNVKIKMQK
ncbi:MAG: GntR family transcriptional regulator [Lentisphaerae bacterium]|nr:GntR family transcriptional regulator [Lentisphaerota bacterium]